MKHFKHVLATTDLSPESFSAVQYAAHLAEGPGAKLSILHVVHSVSLAYSDFVPPVDMTQIEEAIEEAAREKLEQWVKRHLKRSAADAFSWLTTRPRSLSSYPLPCATWATTSRLPAPDPLRWNPPLGRRLISSSWT